MYAGESRRQLPESVMKKYRVEEELGAGTYGAVYKVRDRKTMKKYALKYMVSLEDEASFGIPVTTVREITNLRELDHPNIVYLEDFMLLEDNGVCLLLEYIEMNLCEYLRTYRRNKMPRQQMKSLWYQILQATCYCHQRRIIHRDLKPANILINRNGELKIADFGLARMFEIPLKKHTPEIVTLWYRAPELLLGCKHYTLGVDLWSIGCILAEIATSKPLIPGDCEIDQIMKIFKLLGTPTEATMRGVTQLPGYNSEFPQWKKNNLAEQFKPGEMDEGGLKIIGNLLLYEVGDRTQAKTLLKDPYFNDLDKSRLPAGAWDGDIRTSIFCKSNYIPDSLR